MLSWIYVPFTWLLLEGVRQNEKANVSLRDRLGISLNTGVILWETKKMNNAINKLGEFARYDDLNRSLHENIHCFLDAWYVFGIVVFAILQVILFLLLLSGAITSIYRALTSNSMAEVADAAVIRPVVPGVNMPMTDFPLVGFTLVLTLSFHELGHAFAAATERVKTEGVGLFFALIMPGAFVRLEEGLLPQLPPRAQLKVYCAGAWHNLILALFALLATKCLPILFYPMYEAQPLEKSGHHHLFDHHKHQHGSDIRYSHNVKHSGGLALDLQPYSPFYHLLGKPDDALMALDDTFISSYSSMIDVISKLDARASFATPSSLFHYGDDVHNVLHHSHNNNTTNRPNNIQKQQQQKEQEVVQLQGFCMHPKDISFIQESSSLTHIINREKDSSNECFIVGSIGSSDSDQFVSICHRTTSIIEHAKKFATQAHQEHEREQTLLQEDHGKKQQQPSPFCKHCKKLPIFTCSRSLDCPRVLLNKNEDGVELVEGVLEKVRGSCTRPLLNEGESLVSVHLSSGKSLVWRGDVILDGLQLALTPAAMKLRPFVSTFIYDAANTWMELSSFFSTKSSSSSGASTMNDANRGQTDTDTKSNHGDFIIAWLVHFPASILTFFTMLAQVSISIALLNILPIYYLDGHLASVQFIRLWLLSAPPPPPPPTRKLHSSSSGGNSKHHISININSSNISSSSTGSGAGGLGGSSLSRTSSAHRPTSPTSDATYHHRHHHKQDDPSDTTEDPELEQLLRDQYHDWNAIHKRQTRYTWTLLGTGSVLVFINVALGSVALFG